MLAAIVCAAALAAATTAVVAAPAGDRVTSMPGAPPLNFKMYSGYVSLPPDQHTVPGTVKQLFYIFAGSQSPTAATDPVVLWENGGPGCSSLGGFMGELGPWRAGSDGQQLEVRPTAWNRNANMLFVDSPAGVGYSTYHPEESSDNTTAFDSYMFLVRWFNEKFPEFKSNDFYITGESYAGHYIPTLVDKIVDGNAAGINPKLNLKGFMIGNPTTQIDIDFPGTWSSWYDLSLISVPTHEAILPNCDFSKPADWPKYLNPPASCQSKLDAAQKEIGTDINPYDVIAPVCLSSSRKDFEHPHQFLRAHAQGLRANKPFPYYPCEDQWTKDYLNRADVKTALHVNQTSSWVDCRDIKYDYVGGFTATMLPLYAKFKTKTNLRMQIYSGTEDTVVPVQGTRVWMDMINRADTKQSWAAWHHPPDTELAGQVGGWQVVYDRMSFVTVMGAGHMVPQQRPAAAYAMFEAFLSGKPLQ